VKPFRNSFKTPVEEFLSFFWSFLSVDVKIVRNEKTQKNALKISHMEANYEPLTIFHGIVFVKTRQSVI